MIGIGKNLFKANVKAGGVAPTYDADALAYFTANTAITSAADKNAINTFYLGLKSDGIYTKMKAMYLPIWSSASANKWNLFNPSDTNLAFRLNFTTGWTHSSNGIQPLNAYAETFLKPSVSLLQNSAHISFYSQTNNDTGIDMGINSNSVNGRLYMYLKLGGAFGGRNNNTTAERTISNTNGLGHYISNRIDSTNVKLVKNGTTTNVASASNGLDNLEISIGGIYSSTSYVYGTKKCSFASIGDGLTDTESSNFYSRVNTLMTYFGINV